MSRGPCIHPKRPPPPPDLIIDDIVMNILLVYLEYYGDFKKDLEQKAPRICVW